MRCSYCHKRGHNRRTCPDLTMRMKVRADADIAAGHTDSYYIRQYQERIAPKGKKKSQKGPSFRPKLKGRAPIKSKIVK